MSEFYLLLPALDSFLTGAVFFTATLQLLLCLYEVHTKRRKTLVFDALLFTLLFALTVVLSVDSESIHASIRLPWFFVPLSLCLSLCYCILRLLAEYKRSRNTVTPASIKEAFDNLSTGIFFADEDGRAVLKNKMIESVCMSVAGIYPQTLEELQQVFTQMQRLDDAIDLYRTEDGKVWLYQTCALAQKGVESYIQVTVQDVTDLFKANRLLQEENEILKKTNVDISQMMERLSDRIREQETLALKTRIHNDIGMSLIALSQLFSEGSQKDVETQIQLLRNAVGYFANNRLDGCAGSMEAVYLLAMNLGVNFSVKGDYSRCESLLISAAEVCITNCVTHAGGDAVFAEVIPVGTHTVIRLTNNGVKPKSAIKEGGGLSSLRRKAESMGAKMTVAIQPRFVLELVTGEQND